MPNRILLFSVAFLGLASPARAESRSPQPTTAPRVVVLSTVHTKEGARRDALRAAKLLGYPIAIETISTVPRNRNHLGAIIALHRNPRGSIVVTSYIGDVQDAHAHLQAARRYFPSAKVVPTVLPPEDGDGSGWVAGPFISAGLMVVGSHRSYHAAVRAAKTFSTASGIPFSTQGMIFDKSRGLIIPDDDPDEALRGQYVPRRYDYGCGNGFSSERCVTVERSDGYDGLRPGLYIVVAGILGRDAEARIRLAEARRIVATAYVSQTILYMGCRH